MEREPTRPEPIRVALVGVGNCASSLVQGTVYYRGDSEGLSGLMHPELGGYALGDLRFVAAFDVNARKVGKDLAEAIKAEPNNTLSFADVPHLGVRVQRGPTHDGLGRYLGASIEESEETPPT